LVERFVEYADSFEGLAVFAGRCAAALGGVRVVLVYSRSDIVYRMRIDAWKMKLTFLLDFLHAKQAVETLFFQVPFSGRLCSSSCSSPSSEGGDGPGTRRR
jgi:hypothetical protein